MIRKCMRNWILPNGFKSMVGYKVWFRTSHNDINSGIIHAIKGMNHAQIRTDYPNVSDICVHMNDVYRTKADLIAANEERSHKTLITAANI